MSRNKFKFRREIIAAGGIASTGGLDIAAASTFHGTLTLDGAITAAGGSFSSCSLPSAPKTTMTRS